MINIVIFGAPGAGKGTQAEFLTKRYNLVHISTGDVFRKNIKEKTQLGKLADSYIKKGELVPDEVTIKMLEDVVEQNPNAEGFIFDGFPRTEPQAIALDAFLETKGTEVSVMLSLEAEDEILVKRLLERGKISQRADDQDESIIRSRLKEYYSKTETLKNFYQKQGKYKPVNGVGSIVEIAERLTKIVEDI